MIDVRQVIRNLPLNRRIKIWLRAWQLRWCVKPLLCRLGLHKWRYGGECFLADECLSYWDNA